MEAWATTADRRWADRWLHVRRRLGERLRPLSLQARLTLLVAVTVAVVIGAVTYVEMHLFEGGVERDLRDVARSAALTIADDIELRAEPLDPAGIARMLRDFMEATPVLRSITVLQDGAGEWRVVASTSAFEVSPEVVALARAALDRPDGVWSDAVPVLPRVAVPIRRAERPYGAVVVTVSLASVEQIRARGRLIALVAGVLAMGVLTGLIHLLMRRYVHGPIGAIRATMERAARGDLAARAPVQRDDEIGAIGARLNHMLAEMEGFQAALQDRIREATGELRRRNAELVESFDRLFALREALARAEQLAAVGHMAANVAHQIGTPLNLISGYVQMSLDEPGLDPRLAARLQMIQEQISTLAAIVRTLLDRTRRSGERHRVDAGELVERVCEFVRPRLDAGGIRLELDRAEGPLALEVDRAQVELALLNVIANAVDAMPDGGLLRVQVRGADSAVVIEVSDTGPGIAPEVLPRIFEPWVTTKPPGRGTGLGLSITREVIATHGGLIRARNRPDGGASFLIELPRADGGVPTA
jgi:two-component system NtrC family sensor kinase